MPTIGREIAEKIIANDGYYSNDPRVKYVITYTNVWGDQAWAISHSDPHEYYPSQYVRNPKILWSYKNGRS